MAAEHLVHVVGDERVDRRLADIIERVALATLRQQELVQPSELSLAIVSPAEIRDLNRAYRHVDEETDVLSFAMDDDGPSPPRPGAPPYLGDIAISLRRAEVQALEYGHSTKREVAYLTVHGVLHLLGHDHHDPEEQRRMRAAEEEVLTALGLLRTLA